MSQILDDMGRDGDDIKEVLSCTDLRNDIMNIGAALYIGKSITSWERLSCRTCLSELDVGAIDTVSWAIVLVHRLLGLIGVQERLPPL